MIKISSFIFFLFFSFCTNANSLTLAEVYEIALNKDPELKIAEATYRELKKKLKQKELLASYLV